MDSAGFVLWLADAEYVSPVGSDIEWHEVPVDLEDDGVGVVGSDGRGSGCWFPARGGRTAVASKLITISN